MKKENSFAPILFFLVVLFAAGCQTPDPKQAEVEKDNDEQGQGVKDQGGFVQIFDGKSLKGWEGDTNYWRVENGVLIGEITPDKTLETNSFIIWKGGEPKDFELLGEYRITTDGNSGINYRSEQLQDVCF